LQAQGHRLLINGVNPNQIDFGHLYAQNADASWHFLMQFCINISPALFPLKQNNKMHICIVIHARFLSCCIFLIGMNFALKYNERRIGYERVCRLKQEWLSILNHVDLAAVMFDTEGRVIGYNTLAQKKMIQPDIDHIRNFPKELREAFDNCRRRSSVDLVFEPYRISFKKFNHEDETFILLTAREDPSYFELEQIIMMSFDEILVTDGDGVIIKVNKKCEELYGLPSSALIGRKTVDLAKEQVFTPSLTPLVKKQRKKMSCVQKTRTGKQLYVIGTPLFNESGDIYRIIFNSREASEIEILRDQLTQTEMLLDHYKSEIHQLRNVLNAKKEIIYQSKEMDAVYQLAKKIANVDSTILITGETGVGKGMIARFIHQNSLRKDKSMVEINCGAIPEHLIESELFGYAPGAFTGANKQGKKGVIEQANHGTLFLDEVSELTPAVQVKLLHFLQDQTFRRVGGTETVKVDIRIIAATNKDLYQLVKAGMFREDLYYRLNVIPITIPPLRHRPADIHILADWFLSFFNCKYQTSKEMAHEVYTKLLHYQWPGNVRELENLIERLVVTTDSRVITTGHLPPYILETNPLNPAVIVKGILPLKRAVSEVERQLIINSYNTFKNTYKCAEVLQVNQSTVVRKLKKYMNDSVNEKEEAFQ
jgi:PAS domain S-box-containing protein